MCVYVYIYIYSVLLSKFYILYIFYRAYNDKKKRLNYLYVKFVYTVCDDYI